MNNCNGNCNQGRACDCEPDYDDGCDDSDNLTPAERVTLWIMVLVSMALSVSLLGFLFGLLMRWF